ncbi:MAG: transposase family protein, partial [Bacteroidota bacterium]
MSPSTAVSAANQPVPSDEQLEILSVFSEIPDTRHSLGKRHHIALCLALFTLSIAAGNQGFLAIGDWLKSYEAELLKLFNPPKRRL